MKTPTTFAERWANAVAEVGERNFLLFHDSGGVTTSFTYVEMDALFAGVAGKPGITLFAGYLDDATVTEAAIVERCDDGFVWFATGDRATVDEAGFYYFQGRSAEILKIGGENVSLAEIEQVIAEHPAVHEVAVVGVHDPVLDEVPHAFVVLDPAATATTDENARLRRSPSREIQTATHLRVRR